MAARHLLHKSKYMQFQHWLIRQEVKLLEAKGDWELLKWDSGDELRPAIVFDNCKTEHLTLNQKAIAWFDKWKENT